MPLSATEVFGVTLDDILMMVKSTVTFEGFKNISSFVSGKKVFLNAEWVQIDLVSAAPTPPMVLPVSMPKT